MIKLFEERVDFIESFINNNEITFNVLSNKDETIKILDGCLDIVDGHCVYFVSEFR